MKRPRRARTVWRSDLKFLTLKGMDGKVDVGYT